MKITCRICQQKVDEDDADEELRVCIPCIEEKELDIDQIYEDYEEGKISSLKKVDLSNYMKKK